MFSPLPQTEATTYAFSSVFILLQQYAFSFFSVYFILNHTLICPYRNQKPHYHYLRAEINQTAGAGRGVEIKSVLVLLEDFLWRRRICRLCNISGLLICANETLLFHLFETSFNGQRQLIKWIRELRFFVIQPIFKFKTNFLKIFYPCSRVRMIQLT